MRRRKRNYQRNHPIWLYRAVSVRRRFGWARRSPSLRRLRVAYRRGKRLAF